MKKSARSMDLCRITEHRQMIYGVCALWIMLFHADWRIPKKGVLRLFYILQISGNCGVEPFLILSAIGLFHSMNRDSGLLRFYKKRLLRVYLPTFIAVTFYQAYGMCPLNMYLEKLSVIGYWRGSEAWWFVAFILTLYLVYPLIFHIQKRRQWVLPILFLLSVAAMFCFEKISAGKTRNLLRGVSRFPVFLLGCIIAPNFARHKRISVKWMIALIAVSLATYIAYAFIRSRLPASLKYSIRALAYLVISVGLLPLFAMAGELLLRLGGVGSGLYRLLAFYGGFSLECYLLYARFQTILTTRVQQSSGMMGAQFVISWYAFVCTTLFGFLLRAFCERLIESVRHVSLPERAR